MKQSADNSSGNGRNAHGTKEEYEDLQSCDGCGLLRSSYAGTKRWQDVDLVNSQIAKQLGEMSLQDRETMFEEIHGVANPVEETEEFIESELESMQTAINWIRSKKAYEQARFLCPAIVEDRAFRIAILRASEYDGIKAAKRIVRYFQFKLECFGIDHLAHPIQESNLTEGMLHYLRSGAIQILPEKDRVGRSIIFLAHKLDRERQGVNWFGTIWYIFHKLIEDESVQRKGCIFVAFSFCRPDFMDSIMEDRLQKSSILDEAIPIKLVALHFCYDDVLQRLFISAIQMALTSKTRLRLQLHFGSAMECSYKLMSFGISPSALPLDSNGDITNAAWQFNVDSMREKDTEGLGRQSIGIIPTGQDCLLGRGYPFRTFPGNIMLNNVIYRNIDAYAKLNRLEKGKMLEAIVRYFQVVRGSRFLKKEKDDGIWVMATDQEIVSKIAGTIRHPSSSQITGPSARYTSENGITIKVDQQFR